MCVCVSVCVKEKRESMCGRRGVCVKGCRVDGSWKKGPIVLLSNGILVTSIKFRSIASQRKHRDSQITKLPLHYVIGHWVEC